MTRGIVSLAIPLIAGLILSGCQRDDSVHAGNDEYKPRPAVKKMVENQEVSGELATIDPKKKMLVVRVDNGMEQTFKFDERTSVAGLDNSVQSSTLQKPGNMINPGIRNLIGKEGSELTVEWRADGDAKIATHVEVTEVIIATSPRRARRR
jgi:uncharacterized lipoprotein YajG